MLYLTQKFADVASYLEIFVKISVHYMFKCIHVEPFVCMMCIFVFQSTSS